MTSHSFIPLCVVRCLRCCSQGDRRCECANQNKSHHVLSVERRHALYERKKQFVICQIKSNTVGELCGVLKVLLGAFLHKMFLNSNNSSANGTYPPYPTSGISKICRN